MVDAAAAATARAIANGNLSPSAAHVQKNLAKARREWAGLRGALGARPPVPWRAWRPAALSARPGQRTDSALAGQHGRKIAPAEPWRGGLSPP